MIRKDGLANLYIMLAVFSVVYFAIVGKTELINWIPVFLIIIGLVGEQSFKLIEKEEEKDFFTDEIIDEHTRKSLSTSIIFILLSFIVAGLFTQNPILDSIVQLSVTREEKILFGIFMAVAEEVFFRLFALDLLAKLSGSKVFAFITGTGLFVIYHLKVYGAQPSALLYVFIAGMGLNYVAIKTGIVSPTMTAHIINNILYVLKAMG